MAAMETCVATGYVNGQSVLSSDEEKLLVDYVYITGSVQPRCAVLRTITLRNWEKDAKLFGF